MKIMLSLFILFLSSRVLAQNHQNPSQMCPEGTITALQRVAATDSFGNEVSSYYQTYCRPVKKIQQQSQCPEGFMISLYPVIAIDQSGKVISKDFQTYCKKIDSH